MLYMKDILVRYYIPISCDCQYVSYIQEENCVSYTYKNKYIHTQIYIINICILLWNMVM